MKRKIVQNITISLQKKSTVDHFLFYFNLNWFGTNKKNQNCNKPFLSQAIHRGLDLDRFESREEMLRQLAQIFLESNLWEALIYLG